MLHGLARNERLPASCHWMKPDLVASGKNTLSGIVLRPNQFAIGAPDAPISTSITCDQTQQHPAI